MKGRRSNVKRKSKLTRAMLSLVLALCILLPALPARAEEAVTVTLPVIARGLDCTAVLYDEHSLPMKALSLVKDVENKFEIKCEGVKNFTYFIDLQETDTEKLLYDDTRYEVTVFVYYTNEDKLDYVFIVNSDEGNKPDALEFINREKGEKDKLIVNEAPAAVRKVDSAGKALAGAVFGLYDGTKEVARYEGGAFEIHAPAGYENAVLTLREIAAPAGYVLDQTPHTVNIASKSAVTTEINDEDIITVITTDIVITVDGKSAITIVNAPKPTPVPYDQYFSFTKVWLGASENSIDWEMYNADGSRRHKLFDKTVVSKNEWFYEAWFQATEDIEGCYIIEIPPKDYLVRYENVGAYARVTDRCYDGGKIINYKVPKTEDSRNPAVYAALVAVGLAGLIAIIARGRRRKAAKRAGR